MISGFLERRFGLSAAGTNAWIEARAGMTTYLTMAYILFVNPSILGEAIHVEGANVPGQLLTVTALAAAVGTLVMGFWARYPFALAPGMGINAYFTYSVVKGLGIPWQTALGAVFLSGVLFILLSVVGARQFVVNAIPASIKSATAAGIGLFLAIIGCKNGGLVVADSETLITLGPLDSPAALLTAFGLLLMAVLMVRRVRGGLLLGIAATTLAAVATGAPVFAGRPFSTPAGGWLQAPVWPADLFLELDIAGALSLGAIGIVFIFLFVDLFDTAGTLLGLSQRSGFTTASGRLPRANAAFTADAIATTTGALLGTSSTTTYVESAAGIEDGGRTGLAAVIVGILFLLSVFISPLAGVVPAAATAPALILVGALMMTGVRDIDWNDLRTSVPAFLTIIGMPLTYSIANGIAFGIISYTVIHTGTGEWRRVHWLVAVLAVLLIARYAWMAAA
jgi:AGZA family xanthine/uracil permease-like MFS transporter